MRTFRALAAIPAAVLLLVACGDEETTKPTTLAIGGGTTTVATDATGGSTSEGESSTDGSVVDGPLQVDVLVGTNSGPDRIERVKLGNDVTLTITNPDAADSYHVHGYDLEQDVAKGVAAVINFTADTAGTFEVESHETGAVLVVIEVS